MVLVGAPAYLRGIEGDLERRVPDELAEAGVRGVSASFSGQQGVLRCPAPLTDPERVLDLAHDVRGVAAISLDRSCRVTSAPSVTPSGTVPPGADDAPAGGPDDASGTGSTEVDDSRSDPDGVTGGFDTGGFDTVGELLASGPRFSVVSSLIVEAGLTEVFEGDEPITFLAPDNEAFDDLVPDLLAELRNEPDLLAEVLRHHVVSGRWSLGQLATADLVTVDGRPLSLEFDGAEIRDGDLGAANGVVHRIDRVRLPDGLDLRSLSGVPEFVAVSRAGTLELSGPVAAAGDRVRLVVAATSSLHRSNVIDDMSIDTAGLDGGPLEAMIEVVSVLPRTLTTGSAGYDGTSVFVRGTVLDDDARAILVDVADRHGVELDLVERSPATSEQAEALQAELSQVLTDRPIDFAPGSAELDAAAVPVLDVLAALVKSFDGLVVTVEGHTDSAGDPAANLDLSEFRAAVIFLGLLERGVPDSQLAFVGRGGESPVLVGGVEERSASRRVELVVEHVG